MRKLNEQIDKMLAGDDGLAEFIASAYCLLFVAAYFTMLTSSPPGSDVNLLEGYNRSWGELW